MEEKPLPMIALTGGIASGKSTVAEYLRKQGFHVIDADKLGHRVLECGQPSYHKIVETFGEEILNQDASINRRILGNIVFNNPCKLKKLNLISHPLIRSMISEEMEEFASHSRAGLIFLEAALLQETNFITRFQQIWVVETNPAIAMARLGRRNQFTPEEAKARLNAQLNNEARRKQADVLIENNGSLPALHQQVNAILTKMEL